MFRVNHVLIPDSVEQAKVMSRPIAKTADTLSAFQPMYDLLLQHPFMYRFETSVHEDRSGDNSRKTLQERSRSRHASPVSPNQNPCSSAHPTISPQTQLKRALIVQIMEKHHRSKAIEGQQHDFDHQNVQVALQAADTERILECRRQAASRLLQSDLRVQIAQKEDEKRLSKDAIDKERKEAQATLQMIKLDDERLLKQRSLNQEAFREEVEALRQEAGVAYKSRLEVELKEETERAAYQRVLDERASAEQQRRRAEQAKRYQSSCSISDELEREKQNRRKMTELRLILQDFSERDKDLARDRVDVEKKRDCASILRESAREDELKMMNRIRQLTVDKMVEREAVEQIVADQTRETAAADLRREKIQATYKRELDNMIKLKGST